MKRRFEMIYLCVNFVAVLAVLYAYYRVTSLVIAEERIDTDGVDGITFFVFSAPGFIVGLLANAASGVKAVMDFWQRRDYSTFNYLAVGVFAWVLAILGARLHWAIYTSDASEITNLVIWTLVIGLAFGVFIFFCVRTSTGNKTQHDGVVE